MSQTEYKDRVQLANESLNEIVELFEKEDFPNRVEKAYIESIGKPSQHWSMSNKLLQYIAGTSDGRTIKAWSAIERTKKIGATPFFILQPQPISFTKTTHDKDGKEKEEQVSFLRFFASPRIRYEDTEGKAIEGLEPPTQPPLIKVAEKWGMKISYGESNHGEYGYFSPTTNEIHLSTHSVDTFFHELAHKAHSSLEKLKPGQDPQQEAIAQLTACVLCKIFGYDAIPYTYGYIKHYAENAKPQAVQKMCMRILSKVQKILDVILTEEEKVKGEGKN